MSKRSRILAFGSAGALVLVGGVCAVAISGFAGQVLALVLISVGLVLATGLVFYEVGLSEDRERAAERAAMRRRAPRPSGRRPRPRLPRSDGHRRRL